MCALYSREGWEVVYTMRYRRVERERDRENMGRNLGYVLIEREGGREGGRQTQCERCVCGDECRNTREQW